MSCFELQATVFIEGKTSNEDSTHFALTDGRPLPPAPISSAVLGHLETPALASFQSGWGSITGWVCEAEEVGVEINDTPYPVAYGTERADTAAVCGEEATASGFGLRLNWNELGPGDHEVVAVADGAAFGRATVRVATLGGGRSCGARSGPSCRASPGPVRWRTSRPRARRSRSSSGRGRRILSSPRSSEKPTPTLRATPPRRGWGGSPLLGGVLRSRGVGACEAAGDETGQHWQTATRPRRWSCPNEAVSSF